MVRPAGGAPCAPSASSDAATRSTTARSPERTSSARTSTATSRGARPERGARLARSCSASGSRARSRHRQRRSRRSSPSAARQGRSPRRSRRSRHSCARSATVTITGSSEAPKNVYAKIRPAGGAPCAIVVFSADSGDGLITIRASAVASASRKRRPSSIAGPYVICLWLASSSSDGAPVAGPQPATFTVLAPCVVPPLPRFTALASYLWHALRGELRRGNQALQREPHLSTRHDHQDDAGIRDLACAKVGSRAAHLERQALPRAVSAAGYEVVGRALTAARRAACRGGCATCAATAGAAPSCGSARPRASPLAACRRRHPPLARARSSS